YAEINGGLVEGTDVITGAKVNPSAGLSVAPQSILIVEF
ncbi:MAG: cyclomaltodextrinase C-terminal domain-containing protein, partial [Bacteroidales bacterium]|nr:cyclomaltodextrinase C-terminal domain-containing protein [Bacteroidales bacterium]